jgi:hypothetical protein
LRVSFIFVKISIILSITSIYQYLFTHLILSFSQECAFQYAVDAVENNREIENQKYNKKALENLLFLEEMVRLLNCINLKYHYYIYLISYIIIIFILYLISLFIPISKIISLFYIYLSLTFIMHSLFRLKLSFISCPCPLHINF